MRVTVRDVSATDQNAKHTTPLTVSVEVAARVFGGSFAAHARRLVVGVRLALLLGACAVAAGQPVLAMLVCVVPLMRISFALVRVGLRR